MCVSFEAWHQCCYIYMILNGFFFVAPFFTVHRFTHNTHLILVGLLFCTHSVLLCVCDPLIFVFLHPQEMLAMSLACMELQLEQWLHNKGKIGKSVCSLASCWIEMFVENLAEWSFKNH